MLLPCWACRLASNHPHVLRVVADSLLQILLDRARSLHCHVASHSYPVGLTERPFILCRTARSLIFDLSSLTTSLLAGEFSSSCALSLLSSWPGPISHRGHLTALISAFNIQVDFFLYFLCVFLYFLCLLFCIFCVHILCFSAWSTPFVFFLFCFFSFVPH